MRGLSKVATAYPDSNIHHQTHSHQYPTGTNSTVGNPVRKGGEVPHGEHTTKLSVYSALLIQYRRVAIYSS
jgi:hypothetical protein